MLRKFLGGLIFGAGLAISVVAVWGISMCFVLPRVMDPVATETRVSKFENPTDAQVATPDPSAGISQREFSFFKRSEDRMQVPGGGGILAMAPMSTSAGATRPGTQA